MAYNEINREGLNLTDYEWEMFLSEVNKFIEKATPTQDELDDFIVQLAGEYA